MVKKLYESGAARYQMKFLAGGNGLDNPVQWVHIIEDSDVISFLHGGELVFTAGILNSYDEWLLHFAQELHAVGASAFVVNIGPHTKEIPKDLIDYCNEVALPIFSIPWKTRMVDMTRDFCRCIIKSEQMDINITTTFKNILFNVGDIDSQILQMERYGCQKDSRICFVSLNVSGERSEVYDAEKRLKVLAEKTAKAIHDFFISFSYNEQRILVLINYENNEITAFVNEFLRKVKNEMSALRLHIGVSLNQTGIAGQYKNMKRAVCAMELAKSKGETVVYFEKLGMIYKLLNSVEDNDVLKSFYFDVIGKLEKYDRENDTSLAKMLQVYLENNGSLQAVAKKQFVHRNTVINQLKKIEKVTGYDPMELSDKLMFYMGIYIKDILK